MVQSTKKSPTTNIPELDPKKFTGESAVHLTPVCENGQVNDAVYEKFISSILDQNKDYPPPPPLINLVTGADSVSLLTEKSFSLIQGKQKSKKTIFLVLAVAAFLRRQFCTDSVMMEGIGGGIVLWFDTEQGESYAARSMKLILTLSGHETTPRLIYCDLRKYTPKERLEIIHAAIARTPEARLVVIDGLIDLITNWREPEESHELFTKLLRWCSTYNVHISGVLHQNKADRNAREIVGTIASQKCEIEITVEADQTDKARSIVSCKDGRALPFDPFSIRWDKGSLPCIEQEYIVPMGAKKSPGEKLYATGKRVAEAVFKPLTRLKYKDAVAQIMKTEPTGKSTAESRIKDYLLWDFIEQDEAGLYRKKMTA